MTTPLPRTLVGWLPVLFGRVLFPGAADPDRRVRAGSLLLVILLPAALLYPTLGFHLLEPDEGRYAQIPKEMLAAGEWVVPTLQGEPYLDKPPLMYWLVTLSYRAFGVSPAAARLVPAVCVHLTVLAVYLIGRRSVGQRAALWAALLLSVAPGFVSVARLLVLDGLLVLCVTLSVLCGFEAVRAGRVRWGWWLLSALASGLGFLTKGPISEVLLFVPLWVYGWLASGETTATDPTPRPPPPQGEGEEDRRGSTPAGGGGTGPVPPPPAGVGVRGWGPLRPARPRWFHYLAFFAVVLAVNLPWYVAVYLREPLFLKQFFWEHNVLRFLQPFDHLQPVWYYAPILLGGLLPGTLLVVPYLRQLVAGGEGARPSAAGGFWLLAGGWCVFFFSCSGSKLPTYILPAYPFLCLALGEFVSRTRWDAAVGTRAGIGAMAAVVLAVHHVGLPWYARERSPWGRPEVVERFVTDPGTEVVCYPRNCDSVAFYTGRADLDRVRTKDTNQLYVDCHHRPRTVILFTHGDSLAGFRALLPASLEVVEVVSLKRPGGGLTGALAGKSPWGLCDIAVVAPRGR